MLTLYGPSKHCLHKCADAEHQCSSVGPSSVALQVSDHAAAARSYKSLSTCAGSSAGTPSSVHVTGTSAAVPDGQVPSRSLPSAAGELTADAMPGISQRATSQRATSFVGTADYVAPEVMLAAQASRSAG